jgi:hypothetical protein
MNLSESIRSHKTAIANANDELRKIRESIVGELRQIAESHPTIKLYPSKRTVRSLRFAGTNPTTSTPTNSGTVADKVRNLILSTPEKRMSASAIRAAFIASGDTRTLNFTILANAGIVKSVGVSESTGKAGRPGFVYAIA